jgi:hypothetical protein
VLYQQPDAVLATLGSYCHRLSVASALVATLWYSRHLVAQVTLAILVPATFLMSSIEEARTLYLILQMYLFFFCGLALMRLQAEYLGDLVLVVAAVALPVMVLQLLGWPSWISALATHGRDPVLGMPAFAPTLFVDYLDLKAVLSQTRPAGPFASNQVNTLFFFILFMVTVARAGRPWWLLPLTATYCVVLLSKVAIFGTAALYLLIAKMHPAERRNGVIYVASLGAAFAIYSVLFPGVVQAYISPYVISVSFFARVLDVADSLGLTSLIEWITAHAGDGGTFDRAIRDSVKAFADGATGTNLPIREHVDYGSLGSLTTYSDMARAPWLSAAIVAALVALAVGLHRKDWRAVMTPMSVAGICGVAAMTVVMATAQLQQFWLFFGLAAVPIYGGLLSMTSEGSVGRA